MTASTWRASMIAVVLVAGASVGAVTMMGEDSPAPGDTGRVEEESDHRNPLPFGPERLDDDAVLLNVTNHGDQVAFLEVSVKVEDSWIAGGLMGTLYHGAGGSSPNITNLISASTRGLDVSLLSVKHDGQEATVPVSDRDVHETIGVFQPVNGTKREFSLEPGPHAIFLAASRWDTEWEISSLSEDGEDVTWEIINRDPDMFRIGFSNAPGHWDEVHTQVSTPQAGVVHASTTMVVQHSHAFVYFGTLGHYNDLSVVDAQGNRCDESGFTTLINPEAKSLWVWLPPGEFTLEGLTVSRYGGYMIYSVTDIPLDRGHEPECVEFWNQEDDSSHGIL